MTAPLRDVARIRRALLVWHRRHGLPAPWRESRDPYLCLVAAVMAQQTQMSRVLPAYHHFIARFPTVESLARASTGDVIRVWAGIGYNRRAVHLHAAARDIVRRGWPGDAASLARLPGVGPCTAAVIASFAFGEPAACIDTNVRRVLGRLAGDETLTAPAMQRLAEIALSRRAPGRWNQALMDHGALVCTARPKCGQCAIARWCRSRARFTGGENHRRVLRRQQPYAGSMRYYRGRIIDLLRQLPAGRTVRAADLPALLVRQRSGPLLSRVRVRALVSGLSADGLVVASRGLLALPGDPLTMKAARARQRSGSGSRRR